MFHFITNASQELEHVVWPTPKDTATYMRYTVGTIVVVSLFLAILGYGIREGLTYVRSVTASNMPITHTQNQEATQADYAKALSGLNLSASGITTTATGTKK